MMSVNKLNTSNSNVLNTSPSKVSGSSKSPTKSPSKILKPGKKPVAEVESPLQKNPHSNTMRQVHVNLKPKPMQKPDEDVTNIVSKKRKDVILKPLVPQRSASQDKDKPCSAASSCHDTDASETKSITYEDITDGFDLYGNDRVNELLAFSEQVSSRISKTMQKCDYVAEQAHHLLGANSNKFVNSIDF